MQADIATVFSDLQPVGKLTDVSLVTIVICRSGYLFKHPCVNPFLVWLNHPIGQVCDWLLYESGFSRLGNGGY